MPSVLLLHDPKPPFDLRRLIGLLAERIDGVDRVTLHPHRLFAVARSLSRDAGDGPVVHAFGGRALAVAVMSARGEIVYTPTAFPRRRDVAWLRAVLPYRPIRIVCGSDAERRAWVTSGVPIERCVLIRPGVSLATSPDARAAARARFGYGDADRVVFTPVPAFGVARSDAVWTGCLLNVLRPEAKMLVWSDANFESLRTVKTRMIDPAAMSILDDDTPHAGFAAADVILLPPGDVVSPILIALAMASGRPIVARTTAQVCEMIEDRHTALLTRTGKPKALAERIEDVLLDPELGRKIADRARAEVYDYFLASRLVADYRAIYAKTPAAMPAAAV